MAIKKVPDFAAMRQAFADYIQSEGCSCCRDSEKHTDAQLRLGKLLRMELYDDKSGVAYNKYCTKPTVFTAT